jgi:hypothetical protein
VVRSQASQAIYRSLGRVLAASGSIAGTPRQWSGMVSQVGRVLQELQEKWGSRQGPGQGPSKTGFQARVLPGPCSVQVKEVLRSRVPGRSIWVLSSMGPRQVPQGSRQVLVQAVVLAARAVPGRTWVSQVGGPGRQVQEMVPVSGRQGPTGMGPRQWFQSSRVPSMRSQAVSRSRQASGLPGRVWCRLVVSQAGSLQGQGPMVLVQASGLLLATWQAKWSQSSVLHTGSHRQWSPGRVPGKWSQAGPPGSPRVSSVSRPQA